MRVVLVLGSMMLSVGCDETSSTQAGGGGATSTSAASQGGAATNGPVTTGAPNCVPGDPLSFAKDIQPIFTESCAVSMCHNASTRKEGLDLSEGRAWNEIVGQATKQCNGSKVLIRPKNPEGSYLLDKMRDEDLCGTSKRMPPPTSTQLFNGEVKKIERWVCQGALDN
jgi:hypothetical protein